MGRVKRLVLALAYIYLELGVLVSGAIVYPSLVWSFQNPRFKEGTFRLNVLPRSKLNIICPHVAVSLVEKEDVDNKPNYENFWRVDNASYQSCNVNTNITENKIFLRCDNPRQMQFEKLVFQSHSADSSRVFVKGRTYYFISTSTGSHDSLDNKRNGHCMTANMKMEIYICTGPEDVHCSDVKPTTKQPQFPVDKMMQSAMSSPSTVSVKTVALTSTKQPSPPQTNSTEIVVPHEPEVGAIVTEKEESSIRNGSVWIVLVALLGAMLAVSFGVNVYFRRKQQSLKRKCYERGNSCSPPLMENV